MNYDELMSLYLDLLGGNVKAESPVGPSTIGEPDNDGPPVGVLLECATNLAKDYKPSGSIFVVDID